MTKQELMQIVEPLELTEASMNEIDTLLSPYDDTSQIETDHIKAVIELISLEEALDEEVLKSLKDLVVSTQELAGDIDTIIDSANTEIDLKEKEVTNKLERAHKQLTEIENEQSEQEAPQQQAPQQQAPQQQVPQQQAPQQQVPQQQVPQQQAPQQVVNPTV